jgi:hypothetical protein
MIRDPQTLEALLHAMNRFVRERLVPAEQLVASGRASRRYLARGRDWLAP